MTWKLKLKEKPYKLYLGDCIEVMKILPANSVHCICTDGPYGISFMGKEWDSFKTNEQYMKFSYKWAKQAYRILKPGGYLLSFSGTKTYGWMQVGIEKAGFICRDMISWIYGSGFPHGNNVSKSIDKQLGAERNKVKTPMGKTGNKYFTGLGDTRPWSEKAAQLGYHEHEDNTPITDEAKHWHGYNTTLKPSQEPIAVFQKPLSEATIAKNCLKWGTGAINIDAGRIQHNENLAINRTDNKKLDTANQGWGFKSVSRGNEGRYPANIITDGSPEVLACFPNSKDGIAISRNKIKGQHSGNTIFGKRNVDLKDVGYGGSGSAARFYYCAKPSVREREQGLENWHKVQSSFWQTGNGASGKPSSIETNRKERSPRANSHPTIKPIDLMRYLICIYCPHNGIVLDPFTGSGTTGIACIKAGKRFIGIEKDKHYIQIANQRINHHYFYR